MTYLLLAGGFIAVATVVLLVARRRTGGSQPQARPSARAILGTVVVLAVLTVVFDNLMIAAGLFTFGAEHLVGVHLGRAPVEDLSYPVAAALLLPALWTWLGTRHGGRGADRSAADRDARRSSDHPPAHHRPGDRPARERRA